MTISLLISGLLATVAPLLVSTEDRAVWKMRT